MRAWKELNPKAKRIIGWGGGSVLAITLLTAIAPDVDRSDDGNANRNRKPVQHILTDRNTRQLGADALAAKAITQGKRIAELETSYQKLEEQIRHKKMTAIPDDVMERINKMDSTMQALSRENSELKKQLEAAPATTPVKEDKRETSSGGTTNNQFDPSLLNDFAAADYEAGQNEAQGGNYRGAVDPVAANVSLRTVESQRSTSDAEAAGDEDPYIEVYIPAGSIVSAELLSGLDAPTKDSARRDPTPVLLRVKHEALLANGHTADITQCLIGLEGFGDLSSERAMFRGQGITCIRDDGGVLESEISGYAVGEDGKVGLRGRLVSKQGQMVAKAMMAGFAQAAGDAFDVNTIPIISTDGDKNPYRQAFSKETAQSAFVQGTGEGLERVAEFYLDMAEEMFPVIEVDAGRQIDFILTKGVSLQLRGPQA